MNNLSQYRDKYLTFRSFFFCAVVMILGLYQNLVIMSVYEIQIVR
jgi:hypothetical protein